MRLTVEAIEQAELRMNPLNDREVVLRGLEVTEIANLGVLKNQVDCIDLTDNNISQIQHLPLMTRLRTLIVCNNQIDSISPDISKSLPNLVNLVLTNNRISKISEIDNLKGLRLELLNLEENPVYFADKYKEHTVKLLPSLLLLDEERVSKNSQPTD